MRGFAAPRCRPCQRGSPGQAPHARQNSGGAPCTNTRTSLRTQPQIIRSADTWVRQAWWGLRARETTHEIKLHVQDGEGVSSARDQADSVHMAVDGAIIMKRNERMLVTKCFGVLSWVACCAAISSITCKLTLPALCRGHIAASPSHPAVLHCIGGLGGVWSIGGVLVKSENSYQARPGGTLAAPA